MRVLIVEDEETVGEVFVDYLRELGHLPVVVPSAEAALGTLRAEPPDAILLDICLPGMSGLEFLELPSVRESRVPIIAVSGIASERQARECLRLGALEFIGKPVPLDRLGDVLEVLESYALSRGAGEPAPRPNRRRAPRAPVALPVRVVESDGSEWLGTSVTLSAFSIRVRPRSPVRAGRVAQLSFTPPDGGTAVEAMALLVREDREGFVFFFADLNAPAVQRLSAVVAQLGSG